MVGELVRSRRERMGMSLTGLSREMGGSPGAAYLSKLENGIVEASSTTAVKMADALMLPRDIVLNATGWASPEQCREGKERMQQLIGESSPVVTMVPVMDAEAPEGPFLPGRQRKLRRDEDVFLIDLRGRSNEPYVGEVLVSRSRKPRDESPVVADVEGTAGAWKWHTSRPTGDWLDNDQGRRVDRGFRVLGTIIKFTTETEIE